jgi:hypothetical protein
MTGAPPSRKFLSGRAVPCQHCTLLISGKKLKKEKTMKNIAFGAVMLLVGIFVVLMIVNGADFTPDKF